MFKKILIALFLVLSISFLTISLWPKKLSGNFEDVSNEQSNQACKYVDELLNKVAKRRQRDFINSRGSLSIQNMKLCYTVLSNYKSASADEKSVQTVKNSDRYQLNIVGENNKKILCYLKYDQSNQKWLFDGLNI
ncbi:hypothetical protein AAEX28_01545 [Lentisphaerota bacterium WC36G]|nr:hypothetical protein LJT99_04430 [Lentisphaerae bacterium WC36]